MDHKVACAILKIGVSTDVIAAFYFKTDCFLGCVFACVMFIDNQGELGKCFHDNNRLFIVNNQQIDINFYMFY